VKPFVKILGPFVLQTYYFALLAEVSLILGGDRVPNRNLSIFLQEIKPFLYFEPVCGKLNYDAFIFHTKANILLVKTIDFVLVFPSAFTSYYELS